MHRVFTRSAWFTHMTAMPSSLFDLARQKVLMHFMTARSFESENYTRGNTSADH